MNDLNPRLSFTHKYPLLCCSSLILLVAVALINTVPLSLQTLVNMAARAQVLTQMTQRLKRPITERRLNLKAEPQQCHATGVYTAYCGKAASVFVKAGFISPFVETHLETVQSPVGLGLGIYNMFE